MLISTLDHSNYLGRIGIGRIFRGTSKVNAPIAKVSTYAYVNPVIAIFLGWAILSEKITATTLIGATVIVCSVAATVRRESG